MTSSKPHFHIFRVAAVMITVALALPGSDAQTITTIASTISSNGDLNPYGVAQVPATSGALIKETFWSVTSTTARICKVEARQLCKSVQVGRLACLPRSILISCRGLVRVALA
jgi:hypothetical protein